MGGKRGFGLGRLLAPIALLCATGVSAQSQQAPPPQATPSSAIIVLDGSRSMWTKVGGQSKVAIVRTALGDAFKTYEDRVAFGLVAAGHRQGKTCAEAELIAKPGELSSKNSGQASVRGRLQAKAWTADRGGAGRGRQADAGHGPRRRAHHRRPRQLQGQCLRHGEVAEASRAGVAHPCDRV